MFAKNFRESCNLTQTDFASRVGVRQDAVSRWESTGQISYDDMVKICCAFGITMDQLTEYKKPAPAALLLDNTWRAPDFTKRTVVDYLEAYAAARKDELGERYNNLILDLRNNVSKSIIKPKVAVIGRSDVGKSALINSVLGAEKMPTDWTPTTSIAVYIKHLSDRPKYMEEEVWIFKNEVGEEKNWDDAKLSDEEYCRQWKLAGGSADILKTYGTRQGDMYDNGESGAAVLFVDSPVLCNCDIIDLPGFGTGDRSEDDAMALRAKQSADILIYMSIANGFMRQEDIEYIKESLQGLTVLEKKGENDIAPLSNFFIVASQAQTVSMGNPIELKKVLDAGCQRLLQTMPSGFWNMRSTASGHHYTTSALRNRFFTYETTIVDLRTKFDTDLKSILEHLPTIINEKALQHVKNFSAEVGVDIHTEIASYESMVAEKEKHETLLGEIRRSEAKRANDNQNKRIDILKAIDDLRGEAISEFSERYRTTIVIDHIIEAIKQKGFKKKKEDVQALASLLSSELQSSLQSILQNKSQALSTTIDQYLAEFQTSIQFSDFSDFRIHIPFNSTRAFATGLAGLAVYGGLAFWAAGLGNLGAYILVAKGVSILSALGISVGGTAAAAAAVAAIGGPAVLGVALAVIAAIAAFAAFSGGWEKSVAKKLVKTYDEEDALAKFRGVINDFWKETVTAFNASADKLERDWKEYVENLSELINNYDVADIERRIAIAKDVKSFFENIPL